jgi:Sec-independent protein translocase protein TatA
MALDFLNSLKVEEQPLLSMSEMDKNSSASESSSASSEASADEYKSVVSVTDNGSNQGDLLPISEISTDDDLESKSSASEDTKSSSQKSSSKSSSKKYAAIIKALNEKTGAFEDFNEEEFEDSPEAFLDYIDNYAYRNAEALATDYIQRNLNPLQQKFVDLVESGMAEDQAADLVKGYKLADNVNETSLTEDPEKAKKLYAEYLRYTTAFSEEKIQKEVSKREDLGTLVDDALEALPEFKQVLASAEEEYIQEVKQQEMQQKQFQARQAKELQNYLMSTEEIGGIKLTPKMKEKWMREYGVVSTEDGRQLNPILATREMDPNKFDALLRLYHTMGLFKYDRRKNDFVPDFNAIKSLGKNEAISELHRAVESDNLSRRTGTAIESNVDFDVEKEDHKKRWAELANKIYKKS